MPRFAPLLALPLLLTPALAADGPTLSEGVSAADYNRAGRALNDALSELAKAFKAGAPPSRVARLWIADPPAVHRWESTPAAGAPPGVQAQRLVSAAALVPADELWGERRRRFAAVDEVACKLVLIDSLDAQGRLSAKIRFQAVGPAPDGSRLVERAQLASSWVREGERYLLSDLRLIEGEVVRGPGDLFVERARAWGVDSQGTADPRYLPPNQELRYQVIRHAVGGAAAGDLNGDGFDDLLLTTGDELHLYLNEAGERFREVTAEQGLEGVRHVNAPVFADFDNDGDADLYLGRFYGSNLLFENQGGRLVDRTAGSGLAPDDMTAVLAVADLNGDGHLDLYLGRFLDARTEVPDMILYTRNGAPNRVYLGDGKLGFRDVSAASGADDRGLTLGVGIADYDGDGDQDLYLSNDYGRNVFYRNRGDATFEDATLETGTLAISGGMSVSWGDVDSDGRLDLYVSSIGSNQRWFSQDVNIRNYVLNIVQSKRRGRLQELFLDLRKHLGPRWDQVGNLSLAGNYLLRQKADGTFEDWSDRSGARPQGWYWSSGFFDVDNDGHQDILAVAGWLTGKLKDDL